MKKFLSEFKEFIMRGNVMDLAAAVSGFFVVMRLNLILEEMIME